VAGSQTPADPGWQDRLAARQDCGGGRRLRLPIQCQPDRLCHDGQYGDGAAAEEPGDRDPDRAAFLRLDCPAGFDGSGETGLDV